MHIPVFSAMAANKRWKNGAPDLMTPNDLRQAQLDAPYWVNELRAGNMLTIDESYHLERFRFLSFIDNEDFWNALVMHLGSKSPTFWFPALDSAIESGNVHALNALNQGSQLSLQALFFEWIAFNDSARSTASPHPRAIEWFARDDSLHERLGAFCQSALSRDYESAILQAQTPLWWDTPNRCGGADAVISFTKEWCRLHDRFVTLDAGVKNVVGMLTSLNKSEMDRQKLDPLHQRRSRAEALALTAAVEQSIAMVCERLQLPAGLMRTLAGRMTPEDLEDPMLCAVVQYQDPYTENDPHCYAQHRKPLRLAEFLQIKHNAARAEPLPTLLNIQGIKGDSWQIYAVAEPFVNKRPVQSMELPDDLLDSGGDAGPFYTG